LAHSPAYRLGAAHHALYPLHFGTSPTSLGPHLGHQFVSFEDERLCLPAEVLRRSQQVEGRPGQAGYHQGCHHCHRSCQHKVSLVPPICAGPVWVGPIWVEPTGAGPAKRGSGVPRSAKGSKGARRPRSADG